MVYDFGSLAEDLNKIIEYNPKKNLSPHISTSDLLNNCGYKEIVDGHLYIYIPEVNLHEKVKNKILDFVKQNNLQMIVTTTKYCAGDIECRGHLVDPLKIEDNGDNILENQFPENINGASVYFFSEKNFKKYKVLITS